MIRKRIYTHISFGVAIFLVGILVGWYIPHTPRMVAHTNPIRENSAEYHFINPLLLSADVVTEEDSAYASLDTVLTKYVKDKVAAKDAEDISIYFRDLNSGAWEGVHEDHLYSPASMLKIATMIAVLKTAETNPGILDKAVTNSIKSTDLNVGQFYPPQHPITSGKTYTVRALISAMIIESDNNAQALLMQLIGQEQVDKVLHDLQLPVGISGSSDFLSPQQYSRFYRILYNSTYLQPEVSEKTLEFLSQKGFSKGLYAGVPNNVLIAQKFGERTITDNAGNIINRELHDCGIVYYPKHPYFLCVMTKGQDFTKLQNSIAEISKKVWDEVSRVNK